MERKKKINKKNDNQPYVDVKPDVVLLTDVSDSVDGIVRAEHRRPARGVHEQRHGAGLHGTLDRPFKFQDVHAASVKIKEV